MQVRVFVTLKTDVLDPQGEAVSQALLALGFAGVKSARVGKLIELEVEGTGGAQLQSEVASMCERLLRNPVIEDYRYEIVGG